MQELSGNRIVTLRTVFDDYLKVRPLKDHTLKNYTRRVEGHLKDWLPMDVRQITMRMVEDRHRRISEESGKTIANDVFRTLRALLEFATYEYMEEDDEPLLRRNPVRRLTHVRAWNRMHKRRGVIYLTQLKDWTQAVFSLQNVTLRDFLLLLLFTGLRHAEASELKWENVDLKNGVIKLVNPKNGIDADIPLCDYMWALLQYRKIGARGSYVFSGRDPERPLTFGSTALKIVRERSGIKWIPHDLRRSYITIGDELEIKKEVLKALVNHREGDINDDYTIRSIERLRRATQQIANAILKAAEM